MQTNQPLDVTGVGIATDGLARPLDLAALFGNSNPVELEIGMGKGTFLTSQAKARKDVNFIGIEWAKWFWRYASDRLRRNGCTNARTFRADAALFVDEFLTAGSVSVIHVYFPDPWPKKRHHKRRLVQPKFMVSADRILVPGGRLLVVTDHADYFEQIDGVIRGSGMELVEYSPPTGAGSGEMVGTNFERKYITEGRPFYAIACRKALRS